MPLHLDLQLQPDRIQFGRLLTRAEVANLVSNRKLRVLQTTVSASIDTWDLLNEEFFSRRPDVELRVYEGEWDLSFLTRLGNLRRFNANCISRVTGIEYIGQLSQLEYLGIGISGLDSFDFLGDIAGDHLSTLTLEATRSKKPRLKYLECFPHLKTLYIEGHSKEIEVIAQLSCLQDLTLRSITVPNLDFLHDLSELWSLDIKLGGTRNLAALAQLKGIKYLELWLIRNLNDLDIKPIERMEGLQFLFLQSLRNVRKLPNLSRLKNLRRLHIEDMKGLENIESVASAPVLEEFIHDSKPNTKPEEYEVLIRAGRIKRMMVGLSNGKMHAALAAMLLRHGISGTVEHPFNFR